jgi:hypothetical protein
MPVQKGGISGSAPPPVLPAPQRPFFEFPYLGYISVLAECQLRFRSIVPPYYK